MSWIWIREGTFPLTNPKASFDTFLMRTPLLNILVGNINSLKFSMTGETEIFITLINKLRTASFQAIETHRV